MHPSRNLVPKIGVALVGSFFLMCYFVVGDSGWIEGGPTEIFGVPGTLLLLATILFTCATIFIAARRAYHAGSWLWLLTTVFIWLVSYLYALVVNRTDSGR